MSHACIICLEPVRTGIFQANLWYKFGGNRFAHISCMSCTICGSRAHGGKRFRLGNQPFCKTHFDELRLRKSFSDLPNEYVRSFLSHQKIFRTRLDEKAKKGEITQEIIEIAQMSILQIEISNFGKLNFKSSDEALKGIDDQIKVFQNVLDERVKRIISHRDALAGSSGSSMSEKTLARVPKVADDILKVEGEEISQSYHAALIAPEELDGSLILTNKRIILTNQLHHERYSISFGEITNLEVVPNLFVLGEEQNGLRVDSPSNKYLITIPIEGDSILALIDKIRALREDYLKVQAKAQASIVIDFTSIKNYLERGGVMVQSVKCPSCGAPVQLPSNGDSTVCSFCKSTVRATDIFDKIKQLAGQ